MPATASAPITSSFNLLSIVHQISFCFVLAVWIGFSNIPEAAGAQRVETAQSSEAQRVETAQSSAAQRVETA